MKKNHTILSVIVPLFAVNAYFTGAFLAKNKGLKRTFAAMGALSAVQLITEMIILFKINKSEE